MDYYSILDVDYNASKEQIQKAFRNLAKRYHPDKNADDFENACIRFNILKDAFDILFDDDKRKKYNSSYKREKYKTNNSSYDVTVDDMGVDIHTMNIHNLCELSDTNDNLSHFFKL